MAAAETAAATVIAEGRFTYKLKGAGAVLSCGLHNLKNSGCATEAAKMAVRPFYDAATEDEQRRAFEVFKQKVPGEAAEYVWEHREDTTCLGARRFGVLCNHRLVYTTAVEQQHSKDGEIRNGGSTAVIGRVLADTGAKLSQLRLQAEADIKRGYEVVPGVVEEVIARARLMANEGWTGRLVDVLVDTVFKVVVRSPHGAHSFEVTISADGTAPDGLTDHDVPLTPEGLCLFVHCLVCPCGAVYSDGFPCRHSSFALALIREFINEYNERQRGEKQDRTPLASKEVSTECTTT